MKTLRYLFCAAAVIAAFSCNKVMQEPEIVPEKNETELIPLTFTATTPDTRTTLDGMSINWLSTDKISVFDGRGENNCFETTDEGKTVHFSGTVTQTAENYFALYPYNADATRFGLSVKTTLPATQTLVKGTFADGLNINAATSADNTTFYFKNVLSVAKFTLDASKLGGKTIKTVKFSSGASLAGDVSILYSNDGITASAGDNTVNEITMQNANGTGLEDGTYYFVVLPNTNRAITMTFEATDGCTASISATLNSDFVANTIKNLGTVQGLTWEEPEQKYYTKVTSIDGLAAGAQYVIGAWFDDGDGEKFYAIPTNPTVDSGKIAGETVTVGSNGIATSDAEGFVWTLSQDGSFWTLSDGTKYLYHSNGGNSGTNITYGLSTSYPWSISEWNSNENGLFRFAGVSDGTANSRGLLFNGSSFGGYALSNYGTDNYCGIDLYVLEGSDERDDVTLSFATPSYELSIGTDDYSNFTGQVVETTPTGVSGIKYKLTGVPVGTINEDTGTISLDGTTVGKATITASFSGNNAYKPAASVSYTITVINPSLVDYVTLDWTYPTGNEAATKSGINAIAGVTTYGLGSDYAESHAPYRIKFDNTNDYIQVKTDVAIGDVTIAYKKIGGGGNSTLTIQESTDGEEFSNVETLTVTGASGATGAVTTINAFDSQSRYVKILFNKVDNVGIGGITINKVDMTPSFTVESPLNVTPDANDYTVAITRKNFTGAITVTVPQDCDWIEASNVASSAESFTISVSANNGAARSSTLSLSADGVQSRQLVVNQAGNEPGSASNPYTVPQALEVISALDDNASTDEVFVTGTVSKVESYDSSHKSITYFISADGTTANQLEVYSGKGVNGADFVDIADLAIGDQVLVKGNLKKFKQGDNMIPEFNYNSVIITFTPATRYTVSLLSVSNGTIAASKTSVGAQSIVTLTATPTAGYEFDGWTVTNLSTNQPIAVTEENKFIMPAANVSVSATFTESQVGPTEPLELIFNVSSNPGDWPTANSTTLTNYTYTLDGVSYTFGLKNVKQNSGYLMCTATAVLGLPAIDGYKLTKVVANNSNSCSTSTQVGVSSSASDASYISGGAIQTWSNTGSTYTYNLSGTAANTVYYLYVTNKNAQITKLTLTYTPAN